MTAVSNSILAALKDAKAYQFQLERRSMQCNDNEHGHGAKKLYAAASVIAQTESSREDFAFASGMENVLDARPSSEGNGSANGGVYIRHGERTKCAVTMVHKSSYQKRIIHQAWGMEEAESMQ
eukprot:scaffold21763_cov72-Skeletonema_dohrnii-CCMP3373.AAC.4